MKFVTLWINEPGYERFNKRYHVPEIVSFCLNSFVKYGHDLTIFSYDPIKNIDSKIAVENANDILPLELFPISSGNSSAAQFSDRFRWKLLSEHPEYCWVDTDIYLIRPIQEFDYYITHDKMGVLKYDNASMWKQMYDFATDPSIILPFDSKEEILYKNNFAKQYGSLERMRKNSSWGFAGNSLLIKYVKHNNLNLCDKDLFFPIDYRNWKSIFIANCGLKTLNEIFPKSYGIHLWYGAIDIYNKGLLHIKNSVFDKIIKDAK